MSGRHEKNDSREGSMLVAVPMRDMPYVCQRLISRGSRDGKAIVRLSSYCHRARGTLLPYFHRGLDVVDLLAISEHHKFCN